MATRIELRAAALVDCEVCGATPDPAIAGSNTCLLPISYAAHQPQWGIFRHVQSISIHICWRCAH
jgi:hypothetical protein